MQRKSSATLGQGSKQLPGLPSLPEDTSMHLEEDTQVLAEQEDDYAEDEARESADAESYVTDDETEEDMFVTHLLSEIRDLRIQVSKPLLAQCRLPSLMYC